MSILNADGSIRDPYRNFIAQSRYSRYIDEKGRRETWTETVDRYMNFMVDHLHENHDYVPPESLVLELRSAIAEHEVMPSMRALMTAGPALARENLAAYNCAYLPIADVRSFSEILYILMCGTGVGFSVERKYVDELPPLPDIFDWGSDVTILVGDSKEGWASAFALLLEEIWENGRIPLFDLTAVRPAGARLRTFGGRASGPEPLYDLFKYTMRLLVSAAGRQLRPIEVHDLACKIASVVVVGGVRRAAMISLSDLGDTEMAEAKTGEWYNNPDTKHRALANNSAVHEGDTTREAFDREWTALQNSGSGERGIFNRRAAQVKASRDGRRPHWVEYGVNPCGEIIMRPYGLCNLTEVIVREDDTLDDLSRKVRLAAILGTWQSTLTKFSFVRDHWRTNAESERLLGASLTGIFGNELLSLGDVMTKIVLEILSTAARMANETEADHLGIPHSAAVTTVKPSGTVSQLTGVASGEHPWYAQHYIRTVRADEQDPLAQLMIDAGIPHARDVMQPTNWVFEFPVAAPEGAVTRADLTAIAHLKHWLLVKRSWCEHNPSVTISVRACEWDEVREWVWAHLDELTGVSFLPYSDHVYDQAPYQEISAERYAELVRDFPEVRWADLSFYESGDQTTGVREFACAADGCEVA